MPYVEPTVVDFKSRFPEFAPVSNALIQLMLNDAIERFGPTWVERDRAKAQMLLVAHMLTLEGEPARSSGGGGSGGGASMGPVQRRKVGDVEVTFANPYSGSGGGSGGLNDYYSMTAYGRLLLVLIRLNFPAIAVV